MASPVNGLTGTTAPQTNTTTSTSTAPSQEVFLQLLVAQMKNQDPMNPTDSTQYVSQLAQFSELEQVIAIRNDLDAQLAATSAQNSAATQTQS